MQKISGREREIKRIIQANQASAVGKLMLGEFKGWDEFLEPDTLNFNDLPRRYLKSGSYDVKKRLSAELRRFCNRNFHNMDIPILSMLYLEIKKHRGLELPLNEFEQKFAKIRDEVLKGSPQHLTVKISLWGLQFLFPENQFVKDIIEAYKIASKSEKEIMKYQEFSHQELIQDREKLQVFLRTKFFAVRAGMLSCFHLLEAYLNGISWDFLRDLSIDLSNRKRKLLEDSTQVSIKDKLLKYPEIISGVKPWAESDADVEGLMSNMKPYRDSLVHPSPFSAPEKFGGYDKLRLFYRIDFDTLEASIELLTRILKRIHFHIHPESRILPKWLTELDSFFNEDDLNA
jgi:hypothetical protein